MLLQKQDSIVDKPIRHWPYILKNRERNVGTTHRACLAVVRAILLLQTYLEGAKFNVRTDYHALKLIFNLADETAKLARGRLHLMKYDIAIVHRANVKNQTADELSPLPTKGTDDSGINEEIPIIAVAMRAQKSLIKV